MVWYGDGKNTTTRHNKALHRSSLVFRLVVIEEHVKPIVASYLDGQMPSSPTGGCVRRKNALGMTKEV